MISEIFYSSIVFLLLVIIILTIAKDQLSRIIDNRDENYESNLQKEEREHEKRKSLLTIKREQGLENYRRRKFESDFREKQRKLEEEYHEKQRKLEEDYQEFLKAQEGKSFFIYKANKDLKFIRKHILPILSDEILTMIHQRSNIHFLFYRRMLGYATSFKNFPCLIEIRNGRVVKCPLNKELVIWKNKKRDKMPFTEKLEAFFE